ncbi:MAG: DUF4340 domain-containing protein [Ruminococcus sp.]|nr:DUF4340 domain-containing protein [Ruminococcus sp.]
MNGKLKGIIACIALVICLGGALTVLKLTDKNNTDDNSETVSSTTESQAEKIMLTDYSAEDILSVNISNKYGEFAVEKPSSGKTAWTIELLEGLNQSISEETSLVEDAAQLEAKKTVEENAEDLSKYGFDNPQGTFTVNLADGTKKTFVVGDNLPEETKYCYVKEQNSDVIYSTLANNVKRFLSDKKDFLNKTLLASPDEEEEVYGTLTVQRSELKRDMVFTDDPNVDSSMMSAQVMISPIYSYLNGTVSADTTHGLWGLSAESAEVIFPKAADLKKYGIDKPTATVLYSGNGNDYKLRIGNPIYETDSQGNETTVVGAHYCYLEGVEGLDCIWVVSADSLPWTTVIPEDIITSVMTYNDILTVDNIIVKSGSDTTIYGVESDDTNVTSAKIDGKETDVDQFKSFYQYILTCPTSEIYSEDPKGDCFLSIEIKAGKGGDKLEFFKDSTTERKAVVKLNGVTSFRIPIKWTEKFVKNISLLSEGKEVEESY